MKPRIPVSLVHLLIALFALVPVCLGQVRVWEGTLTLPTYPWGPDDLNPRFFALENSIIYPYNMQDTLSTTKVDRTYKALFLENEYLRITCLPELGGRIHSVFDKTTNEEMFHTNPVIKPGLIAMRGAWISGGIEWNTGPHGHTVTIVSPVDAMLVENDDGSASLIINNIEKIFRTRWTVEVTLHPGRSYLDEKIRIYNPTDGLHPFYFWNCTAFYNTENTRFIYPMTLGTNHYGNSFFTWPEHNGQDITYLKNYDRPTSVFGYECAFDFFGAYDSGMDRGIVQTANHHELIGKKAWTWGQSDDGIVSQRNLHDFDEQYIEVQSGPLLTQADYGLLEPHQEVAWREFWYSVHGLGDGYEYANPDVAVQTIRDGNSLELRMMATGEFPDARVRVTAQGKKSQTKKVRLTPRQPAVATFSDLPEGPCLIEVLHGDSAHPLAAFTSPLPVPVVEEPELPWWETKKEDFTIDELYLKGMLYDKQTNRPAAREWYGKVLSEDPLHTDANRQLGVLDLEAGLFTSAVAHFERALERNPDDAMSWYYRGACALAQGDLEEAERCGFKMIKYRPESSLGYDLAGRAVFLQGPGNHQQALDLLRMATRQNPRDSMARNHYLLAALAAGIDAEPLSYKPDPSDVVLQAIEAARKNDADGLAAWLHSHVGEVEFALIEAVLKLSEMGLHQEALHVMKAIESPLLAQEATSLSTYYLAYLSHQAGQDNQVSNYLEQAMKLSPDYVFPSRVETIPVLKFAVERNAHDANAHLLLGNLLGGLGRLEEARLHFGHAVRVNEGLATAQRNLGYIAWRGEEDLRAAEDFYRKAIAGRPEDQIFYRDLARILLQNDKREEAIKVMENMPVASRRTDIVEILAQAYVDKEQYTKALDLLADSFFSNWEDRTVSRSVYVRANLERGKQSMDRGDYASALKDFQAALLYPENLGVGRPADPREAETYFWVGTALQALNRGPEAKAAWQTGADGRLGGAAQNEFIAKCQEAID